MTSSLLAGGQGTFLLGAFLNLPYVTGEKKTDVVKTSPLASQEKIDRDSHTAVCRFFGQ